MPLAIHRCLRLRRSGHCRVIRETWERSGYNDKRTKKREHMAQEVSTRVQLALEQIGEDEALTGDLTDSAATAVLEWITQQVRAADAAPDDEAFEQRVKAIRSAARTAARIAADEDVSAAVVVERAQAALQSSASPAAAQSQPAASIAPAAADHPAVAAIPAPEAPAAATAQAPEIQAPDPSVVADSQSAQSTRSNSVWNSLRRRLRRWAHRKV